ncbi:MAG TPA: CFI-box-CTERM domain-containing protein [Nannocystaceae bacterium]|nr:CFI-box-CTERM domain-containing protein [Nannocystaceae bacterium]
MACTGFGRTGALVIGVAGALASPAVHAAEDVLVEFHFQPVPNTQIAIWLVDANGAFVQDVFVTQATGTLGIGNRPGHWDFLSSWRFPYGPRPQVLPVWAHARGKTYPALRFHDDDPGDFDSLGWHENSSSAEPYFCRPLSETENDTISTDTMTCPSPAVFQSDKGQFDGPAVSYYPPRNDLVQFEDGGDSPDVQMFAMLNDLDAVTGATPTGDDPELVTTVIPKAIAEAGPMLAFIEVNLEHDENGVWAFDRDTDHFVDTRLSGYGVEYLGQPSVVYQVEFDPLAITFTGTDMYSGYGEWDGTSGDLYPPDDSISIDHGSGADRLRLVTMNDETFRFGVYSHGPNSGEDPTGGDSGSGTGVTSAGDDGGDSGDASDDGSGDDGWGGGCDFHALPAAESFSLEPVDFDRVRVHFTVPASLAGTDIRDPKIYYRTGQMALAEDNVGSAIQVVPRAAMCSSEVVPGLPMWCEVDQLFGNFEYQIGMRYVDECSNESSLVAESVTTPAQKFQTVEGVCFVATAAWGAAWTDRVAALRFFRDLYLRKTGFGSAVVEFYYANSPVLARAIAKRPWARTATRMVLAPFTDIAIATTRGVQQ